MTKIVLIAWCWCAPFEPAQTAEFTGPSAIAECGTRLAILIALGDADEGECREITGAGS
jgi:hypothetical protein